MAKRPFYFNPDTNIGTFDPPFKRLRVHDASNDVETACGCSDVTPQVERARKGEHVGSVQTQALIEIHERLCGEGGLIEEDLSGVKLTGEGGGGFA